MIAPELTHMADQMSAPPIEVCEITNEWNKTVLRLEFATTDALADYFMRLIDNPIMHGHASKAIGTTLLIWHR